MNHSRDRAGLMAWHSHAINQSCPGMDVVSRIIEQERPIISMSALPQTSAQTSATTGTASAVTGSFRKTGEPDISESRCIRAANRVASWSGRCRSAAAPPSPCSR